MTATAFATATAALDVNGPEDVGLDWDAVDWRFHQEQVRRLRQRIFKATQDGDLKRVRNLQKLMLRSRSNTLVSVLLRLRNISFCRLRTLFRSPSCVALKILCLSRRTCSCWNRQSTASQSRPTSSGPFTSRAAVAVANAVAVIGVQLALRFRCFGIEASKAHPVHVSSLSGQAEACIRPVIRDDRAEDAAMLSRFPSPFGAPAFASWTVLR